MTDQKQDKGLDKGKDSTRAKDTPEEARREATINTTDQQETLKDAHASNPDAIPEGDSVGSRLAALTPGMSLEDAKSAQARIESFSIDYGDGRKVDASSKTGRKGRDGADTAADHASKPAGDVVAGDRKTLEKTSARQQKKLSAESLTSGVMQALAKDGPEAVRDVMQNINQMRDSLKSHLPEGEQRTNLDRQLKQSVIETLPPELQEEMINNSIPHENVKVTEAKLLDPMKGMRDDSVPLLNPEKGTRDDSVPLNPERGTRDNSSSLLDPIAELPVGDLERRFRPPVDGGELPISAGHEAEHELGVPNWVPRLTEDYNRGGRNGEDKVLLAQSKGDESDAKTRLERAPSAVSVQETPTQQTKHAPAGDVHARTAPQESRAPSGDAHDRSAPHSRTERAEKTTLHKVGDATREVQEAKKSHAEGPSGTLVWKDKTGYHQARCADGKVLDANHKSIGNIKDDGTVTIKGQSIKIGSATNKSEYMFLGQDSHGGSVKFMTPESANKLTGMMTSFDGKTSYAVVAGNIFDRSGSFKGHINEKGHVEPIKGVVAIGKDADVNVLFNRFKFEGTENHQSRFFISGNDTSNGALIVPGKEIPGGKGEAMVKLQVKEGMLLDAHGKQVGVLFAPNTDAGQLAGGCVLWSGSKKPVPLCDLKNASFDLKVLGESGHAGRALKGVSLGPAHAGKGGLFDVQSAMDVSSVTYTDKVNKTQDYQHQGLNIAKWAIDEVSGQHVNERLSEARTHVTLKTDLESLVKDGVTNPAKLAEVMNTVRKEREALEPHHDGSKPKAIEKPKADPEKQVGVPRLTNQAASTVDGSLIMDGNAFQIHKGQLHRVHDDGHGQMRADTKPSGKLLGDYKVQLDGMPAIDLAHENRVLLKFTMGGDKTAHRILGMGRSRVTDSGGKVEGGLVSVDDISKKAKATAAKESHANEEYFKKQDVMTKVTQSVTDTLMGGSAEESLKHSGERYDLMIKTFDKACDKLFSTNPTAGEVNTKLMDHNIRTVQTVMDTFGLEIADEQQTRGELKQAQSTMTEATTMAAITVATMGVGTAVSAAANAGKFATFGRFAHATSIAARVGGGAVAGGTIRGVGGYHEGQSGVEAARNVGGGMLEGGIMTAANTLTSFSTAQKLGRGLGLATATETIAGKAVPKAIGQIDEILQAGGIKQTEAWLLKSGIGRAAGSLTDSQAAALKIGLSAGDNLTQSATFGVSNYYRSFNESNAPKTGPFDITEIGIGTATGMLSQGIGGFLGRDSKMFRSFNESLPPEARINLGETVEHFVTQTPTVGASGFAVGVCNAMPTEFDRERQKVAEETGMDVKSIGLKEIIEHGHLGSLVNAVAQSAALNALVSLPGSLAHGRLEQKAGIHTEEYLGPTELGKPTSDSIFKPARDRVAENVADAMLKGNTADGSVELGKKALSWSPSTISKVDRFNTAREKIAALPEEMHADMTSLLGKVGEKGVKDDARLRIVENLFKVYDTTDATSAKNMHDVASRMLECMRPIANEQKERPAVPKLEEIFDREQVALIKAMDLAQSKLKPVEISSAEHLELVEEGYDRARKKAPGGVPGQDRILHLVVGPPGAGKSSSLVNPFKSRDRCMEVDSDDVKPTVQGYISKFRGMEHVGFGAGIVHPVSSKVAHDVLMKAMDHGDNIIHPILGRTPEGVLDLVMTAKAKGYKVAIHIADVPPEESSRRAFDRGQKEVDKEGKRQMVPPTYSLETVQWGPQITFERLTKHMQGFIDELNYCNTNIPKDATPNIERRSPSRIREGVENYVLEKRPRDKSIEAGAGGDWPKINEIESPDVVRQIERMSCVSACGEMLSNGRLTQADLIKELKAPTDTLNLEGKLGSDWVGHGTSDESLDLLLGLKSSWATELRERDPDNLSYRRAEPSHTVVVDGVSENGNIVIRDPADGTKYEMTRKDFLFHWTGRVVRRRIQ